MGWIPVYGMEWPASNGVNWDGTTSSTVDATGEKVAWSGPIWTPNRGTKNITKVGWRFATHVVAGGSGATLSLQNVDTATGAPIQPDGTQDQTVAVTLPGTAGWFMSNALSAVRTVSYGELVSAVLEFNGGGRLGADTILVDNLNAQGTAPRTLNAGVSLYTTSWAIQAVVPSVIFEFDDGSFGSFIGGHPFASRTTRTFNSSSTPDERSVRFRPSVPIKIDGCWAEMRCVTNAANFDVVLYADNVAVATVSVDANAIDTAASTKFLRLPLPETTLSPGVVYDLAFKPTTGVADITMYTAEMNSASHLQALPGGSVFTSAERTDGGAWTENTAARLAAGFFVSAIPDYAPSMLVNNAGLVG